MGALDQTPPAPAAASQRLMVLMFTDLVNSTAIKEQIGNQAYAQLLHRHDAFLRQSLDIVGGGRVVQDTGDGYFLSFESVAQAVSAALIFQWLMTAESWPLPFASRVGLHLGEVDQHTNAIDARERFVGSAIDLASRVMSLARGGQILLTRAVFDAARQIVREHPAPVPMTRAPPLQWMAHGPYMFKGAAEPVDVFEVGAEGAAPLAPPPDSDKAKRHIRPGDEDTLGWRPALGRSLESTTNWILVEKLGEGGFGEVWLAEQVKTANKRVFKFCFDPERLRALKREVVLFRLLKKALGDRRDIAAVKEWQFERAPYFIELDYTPEGNLTQWAQKQGGIAKVPLQDRLRYVAEIAQALAAAHSVGILHKDIKPSNVLMASHHGGPVYPRLTDFGIGILTDRSRLADFDISGNDFTASNITMNDSSRTGTRMYTPPEALLDQPHTVQGDIYALGVLLYQMTIADLARPLGVGWEREVSGELLREDIAACVDVEPKRRLASAAELAQRLETIDARRTERATLVAATRSAEQRLRRRRLARTAAIAMVVLLALTAVATIFHVHNVNAERDLTKAALVQVRTQKAEVEKQKAQVEAQRNKAVEEKQNADAVLNFLVDSVLARATPENIGDAKVSNAIVRAMIQPAAASVAKSFAGRPFVEAVIRNTLATTFREIGRSDLALPQAELALALVTKLLPVDNPFRITVLSNYAVVLRSLGRAREAEPPSKQALELRTRVLGADHPDTIMSLDNYAFVLKSLGRGKEAEPLYKEALDRSTQVLGVDDPETIISLNNYVSLLISLDRAKEAEPLSKEALERSTRVLGMDHPGTIISLNNYAGVLDTLGHAKEAEPLLKEVLDRRTQVLGVDHADRITSLNTYAFVLDSLGRAKEAAPLYKEVLERRTRLLGADHLDTIASLDEYAFVLDSVGLTKDAEPLHKEALERRTRLLGADHPDTIASLNEYAFVLNALGRAKEAEPLYKEALERRMRLFGIDDPGTIVSTHNYARMLEKLGRTKEAEPLFKQAMERAVASPALGPEHPHTKEIAKNYAAFLDALSRSKEAAAMRKRFGLAAPASRPTTSPATKPASP
jgi:serine/threonine protein kinase/class 3 adenylate cyclase